MPGDSIFLFVDGYTTFEGLFTLRHAYTVRVARGWGVVTGWAQATAAAALAGDCAACAAPRPALPSLAPPAAQANPGSSLPGDTEATAVDLGSATSLVRGDSSVGYNNDAQGSCAPTTSVDRVYLWTAPAVGRVNISVCPYGNWCGGGAGGGCSAAGAGRMAVCVARLCRVALRRRAGWLLTLHPPSVRGAGSTRSCMCAGGARRLRATTTPRCPTARPRSAALASSSERLQPPRAAWGDWGGCTACSAAANRCMPACPPACPPTHPLVCVCVSMPVATGIDYFIYIDGFRATNAGAYTFTLSFLVSLRLVIECTVGRPGGAVGARGFASVRASVRARAGPAAAPAARP